MNCRKPCPPVSLVSMSVIAGLFLLSASSAHAKKTDVVVLRNGDSITGEIKKLELGKLKYSTDDMGTIYIEWDKVARIRSKDRFEVRLKTGLRYVGHIEHAPEPGQMVVVAAADTTTLGIPWVVAITPLNLGFWSRLKLDLDLGFSYKKANKDVQLTFSSSASYRMERYLAKIDGTSALSDREDVNKSTWNSLGLQLIRFVGRKWLIMALADAEQNEELDLDLRYTVGGAWGYFLIRTNRILLVPYGGVVAGGEDYGGSESIEYNTEALTGLMLEVFQYDEPEINISVSSAAYFGLPDFDRTRISLKSQLSIELIADLFWKLTFYDDYNSEASGATEVKNDFRLTTSIGWSY